MKQLIGPLIEAHGLNMLVNLVQLEMARQDAVKAGVTVSAADFQEERQQTLDKLFKESDDKTQDQIDAALQQEGRCDGQEAARRNSARSRSAAGSVSVTEEHQPGRI